MTLILSINNDLTFCYFCLRASSFLISSCFSNTRSFSFSVRRLSSMPTQSRFFQNIVVRLFRLINDIIAPLDQVPEFFHAIMRFVPQMKTDFTSLGVR